MTPITPEEFVARWNPLVPFLNNEYLSYDLVTIDITNTSTAVLEALSEPTREFLVKVGLPLRGSLQLQFEPLRDGVSFLSSLGNPNLIAFTSYVAIGGDRGFDFPYSIFMCIETNSDRVYSVFAIKQSPVEASFVNSNIRIFSQMLLEHIEDYIEAFPDEESHEDDARLEIRKQLLLAQRERLRVLDPPALEDDQTWWSREFVDHLDDLLV